jgi:hypothetical protein
MALSTQDKLKQRLPPFIVPNQLLDDLTKIFANRLDDTKSGHNTIRDMLTVDSASGRFLDEIFEDHGLFRSEDEKDHLLRIRAKNIIPTYRELGTKHGIEDYLAFLVKTRPCIEECWEGKWAWIIGFSAIGLDTWLGAALQFYMLLWNQTQLTQDELEDIVESIVPVHVPYGLEYTTPLEPLWGEKTEMVKFPHEEASWDFDAGFPHTKSVKDGLFTLDTTGSGDKAVWIQDVVDRCFWPTRCDPDTGWTIQFRVRVDADSEGGSPPGHLVYVCDGQNLFGFYLTKDGAEDFGGVASGFDMDLSDDLHTFRVAGGGALGANFKIWVDGELKKTGALGSFTTKRMQFGDLSTNPHQYAGKTVWDYFRIYTAGAVEWGEAAGYVYETGDDFLSGTNTNFDVLYNALIPTAYSCSRESPTIDLGITWASYTWLVDWLDYIRHDMNVDAKLHLSFSPDGAGWSSWREYEQNEIILSADLRRYVKYRLEVTIGSEESLSDYVFKQWTMKGLPVGYSVFVPEYSEANLPLEREYMPERVPV